MDESIVDDILNQEDDFKLLIKYVKLWKKYIKICKAQRK